MTTIEDLRRSLEELAGDASDGAGMAERARTGAARIQRRRTITAAAAVCLVAVATAVIPLAVNRLRADGPAPASVTPYRGPGQLTVRPAPDSKYGWNLGTDGFLQFMTPSLKGSNSTRDCCAEVRVYDPGTYDSRVLRRGERITVGDHPAFRATTRVREGGHWLRGPAGSSQGPGATKDMLTVGWKDPSGAWVTVLDAGTGLGPPTSLDPLSLLVDVGADVRLGAPRDVLVPMHFAAVPGNLPITFTDVDDTSHPKDGQVAVLGLGGDRQPAVGILRPGYLDVDTPLTITAWTANGYAPWIEMLYSPVNTTVAGHPARYYEDDSGSVSVPPGGSVMLVEIGGCGIQIGVKDRTKITRADLEAMFAGATFDKCDSTKTWTRPLN